MSQQAAVQSHRVGSVAGFLGLQRPGLLLAGVGVAVSLFGWFSEPTQFWRSYLWAYTFWLHLSLGCLGMLMVHHLVGGRWSARIRNVLEAGASSLPLLGLLFLPLLLGLGTLYPWADPQEVAHSPLLQSKTGYLNVPFFVGRAVAYFAVWCGLSLLLNRWSRIQSEANQRAVQVRLRRLSTGGLILFMLTATFAAFDWQMSLEPEWFSSIYGLLIMAGQGVAAVALAVLALKALTGKMELDDDWRQTFNDLGNLLLGFVMIWAYFAFSQLLVIWSANIPEEAVWYLHRSQSGWLAVGMGAVAVQFVVPFLLLLLRRLKRSPGLLASVAILALLGRLLDLTWLIGPAFSPDRATVHWLDLALLLAFGGIWLTWFGRQWRDRSGFARFDPHV